MNELMVLPSPDSVPVAALIDACHQVYLDREYWTDGHLTVDAALELMDRGGAIEKLLQRRGQADEARRATRILEAAVGRALGEPMARVEIARRGGLLVAGHPPAPFPGEEVRVDDRKLFRLMWAHRDAWLSRLEGKALSRSEVLALIKRKRTEEAADDVPEDTQPDIREGRFQDVLDEIEDGSVDLILTDPPYAADALEGGSYSDLGAFAKRKLKPGGSLICYVGQTTLPGALEHFTASGLRYWWTLCLEHAHGGQQLPGKWVIVEWKPLLWFVNDFRAGREYVHDRFRGSQPDKLAHEWAQGSDEVKYLIEKLTEPEGLVVDPFAGSGAFGKAALALGRQFIGADLTLGQREGAVA